MNVNRQQMTTPISTGSGMPACGHASDAIQGRRAVSGVKHVVTGTTGTERIGGATGATVVAVRDRHDAIALAYTTSTFPGPHAWSPPTG